MSTSKVNHGEGDPESAQRFNDAETRFVESERGKKKVRDGADIKPDEAPQLAEAERLGKARAKGQEANSAPEPASRR